MLARRPRAAPPAGGVPGASPDVACAPDRPLLGLPGVAARRAALYAAAGLQTRRELLYHLPARYRIRPPARALADLVPGELGALVGRVRRTSLRRRGRRSTVSLVLQCDGGGELTALLFNRAYLAKGLRGKRLWIAGRLEARDDGIPRLIGADYEPLADDAPVELPLQLAPLPIYRLPAGIPPRVHRKLLAHVLADGGPRDWRETAGARVPALRCRTGEPALPDALRAIHLPATVDGARAARQRLARDEATALALDVLARRRALEAGHAPALPLDDALHARILEALPHAPTRAQARAIDELRAELRAPPRGRPLARLLQGDVGSGKTLVAFYALLAAAATGHQAALMAPTEVLAAQHARALAALLPRLLGPDAAPPAWIAGSAACAAPGGVLAGPPARRALAEGRALVAVGTHGLQAARLAFACLAVTVVDEQHRFGVLQRTRLREKGAAAHLLVLTATPIPRTLALTAYGELDVTLIDELPPGRAPRRTEVVEREGQPALWRELREAVARGERGYVVCPSIGAAVGPTPSASADVPQVILDADDDADDHSVARTLARVRRALGASARVGAVHGRLRAAEREAALDAFRGGDLDVLVATVLVEVGLDVPEATWVVIPDAMRFGLATLHQIRGRVGRGGRAGRCVLLGPIREPVARARAAALLASEDGFLLAEKDLELRGPGEVLGTRQHGLPDFCALDPVRDVALLAEARREAQAAAGVLGRKQLVALRAAVFPSLVLRGENLLAGG